MHKRHSNLIKLSRFFLKPEGWHKTPDINIGQVGWEVVATTVSWWFSLCQLYFLQCSTLFWLRRGPLCRVDLRLLWFFCCGRQSGWIDWAPGSEREKLRVSETHSCVYPPFPRAVGSDPEFARYVAGVSQAMQQKRQVQHIRRPSNTRSNWPMPDEQHRTWSHPEYFNEGLVPIHLLLPLIHCQTSWHFSTCPT